jgi:hypothetical protein
VNLLIEGHSRGALFVKRKTAHSAPAFLQKNYNMAQLSFLEQGRRILSSVRNQRRWCMKHQKSYLETAFVRRELNNLEGALSTIKTSEQMKRYLERKESVIRLLMPGKNVKNHRQLSELLEINI